MFTTCPSCALNLAVTAADLRVGQGYVRCGRCVSVFNALISLADEAEVGPDEARVEDIASATQSRPLPEALRSVLQPAADEGAELTDESRDAGTARSRPSCSKATPSCRPRSSSTRRRWTSS